MTAKMMTGLAVKTTILTATRGQGAAEVAVAAGLLKGPEVGRGQEAVEVAAAADPVLVPPTREEETAAEVRQTGGGRTKSGRTTSSGLRRRCQSTSARTPTGTGSATTGKRSAASVAGNEKGIGRGRPRGRGAHQNHRTHHTAGAAAGAAAVSDVAAPAHPAAPFTASAGPCAKKLGENGTTQSHRRPPWLLKH